MTAPDTLSMYRTIIIKHTKHTNVHLNLPKMLLFVTGFMYKFSTKVACEYTLAI